MLVHGFEYAAIFDQFEQKQWQKDLTQQIFHGVMSVKQETLQGTLSSYTQQNGDCKRLSLVEP